MKLAIFFLIIGVIGFGSMIICNAVEIQKRPTTEEVKAMIKGNTTSIFDKQTAGRLESCLYTLIEIEHIQITKPQLWRLKLWKLRRRLEIHLKWLAEREEQRQEMARDKFEEER
ncbi:unnamed protein product [marine sediment metagenome]|uniref:Uncharacterized protein n=1 Tax=marine sediment metagenome TaxID=412755 RepID=X1J849_9ZZZZ